MEREARVESLVAGAMDLDEEEGGGAGEGVFATIEGRFDRNAAERGRDGAGEEVEERRRQQQQQQQQQQQRGAAEAVGLGRAGW